jgi:hypothetical protein
LLRGALPLFDLIDPLNQSTFLCTCIMNLLLSSFVTVWRPRMAKKLLREDLDLQLRKEILQSVFLLTNAITGDYLFYVNAKSIISLEVEPNCGLANILAHWRFLAGRYWNYRQVHSR